MEFISCESYERIKGTNIGTKLRIPSNAYENIILMPFITYLSHEIYVHN